MKMKWKRTKNLFGVSLIILSLVIMMLPIDQVRAQQTISSNNVLSYEPIDNEGVIDGEEGGEELENVEETEKPQNFYLSSTVLNANIPYENVQKPQPPRKNRQIDLNKTVAFDQGGNPLEDVIFEIESSTLKGVSVSENSIVQLSQIDTLQLYSDESPENKYSRIGEHAFDNENNQKDLGNVTTVKIRSTSDPFTIGARAFAYQSNLRTVEFENGLPLTAIETGAFLQCRSLSQFFIPTRVMDIQPYAFAGDINLRTFLIENGNDKYITLPGYEGMLLEKLSDRPEYALVAWPSGTGELEIPANQNITTIKEGAFAGCVGLTKIKVPESVTNIEEGAFADCPDLQTVEMPGDGQYTTIDLEGNVQLIVRKTTDVYDTIVGSLGTSVSGNWIIPGSIPEKNVEIRKIGNNAFKGRADVRSVEFPNTLSEIGNEAFMNCIFLGTVHFNDALKTIGRSAFEGCGFVDVSLPENMVSIGNRAFWCSALNRISVLGKDTQIGTDAIYYVNDINAPKITVRGQNGSHAKNYVLISHQNTNLVFEEIFEEYPEMPKVELHVLSKTNLVDGKKVTIKAIGLNNTKVPAGSYYLIIEDGTEHGAFGNIVASGRVPFDIRLEYYTPRGDKGEVSRNVNMQITMPVPSSLVKPGSIYNVYTVTEGQKEELTCQVDSNKNLITFTAPHFSPYLITGTWKTPGSSSSGSSSSGSSSSGSSSSGSSSSGSSSTGSSSNASSSSASSSVGGTSAGGSTGGQGNQSSGGGSIGSGLTPVIPYTPSLAAGPLGAETVVGGVNGLGQKDHVPKTGGPVHPKWAFAFVLLGVGVFILATDSKKKVSK